MKFKLLSIALLLPFAAFASNTITFYGEVSDSTCDITVNGASGDVAVQLPTVLASAVTAGGAAGATPFKFTASGCTAGALQTTVGMRLIPASTTTAGNIVNIATGATAAQNVSVRIMDNAIPATPTQANFANGEFNSAMVTIPATATDSVDFNFIAQYYPETGGAVTPGKVVSQLQYALTYQ